MSAFAFLRSTKEYALLGAMMACTACEPGLGSRALPHLQRRTIIVLLDLSGSMTPGWVDGPLRQLAAEARPNDRLVILPLTDRVAEPALLDTLMPGGQFGQLSRTLHVATRESDRLARIQQAAFGQQLQQLARHAYQVRSTSRGTSIVEALCETATTALGVIAKDVVHSAAGKREAGGR